MHDASLCIWVGLFGQTQPVWSHNSIYTLYLSDQTKFDRDEGLWMQENSVYACKHAYMAACMCTDIIVLSGMSPQFNRWYLDLSNLTELGQDMGPCMPENSVYACMHVVSGQNQNALADSMSDTSDSLNKLKTPKISRGTEIRKYRSKPTNGLTDIQEICKFLEKVYKHLENVSKKIQKDTSSRTWDIFIFL